MTTNMLDCARRIVAGSAVVAITIVATSPSATEAATLYKGAYYAMDSFNDSTARRFVGGPTDVGGTVFEIFGMAMKFDKDKVSFAFSSNLPKDGTIVPNAHGYGQVGHGDLFILNNGKFLGINFTRGNWSGTPTTGVYEVDSVKNVAVAKDGWPNLSSYSSFVQSRGGTPSMGDLAVNDPLFGNSTASLINSGRKIADIDEADLSGFDFGHFGANAPVFGFSVSKNVLGHGDLIAWLQEECGNDGVAIKEEVPEPVSILGTLTALGAGYVMKRRRSKLQKAQPKA